MIWLDILFCSFIFIFMFIFYFYFSIKSLLNYKFHSIFIKGLIKYGYSNFKLEILEYCEPNRCLEIEKNYIFFN